MTTPPQPPPATPPPAGGAAPSPGSNDDKTWALVAHFGGAAGVLIACGTLGWVAPLIAFLTKGKESPTVRAHALGALNFQITWAIIIVGTSVLIGCLSVVTFGLGALLYFVIFLLALVPIIFGVLAGIKANDGQVYTYPMSLKLVK
jgi:uncharacterized protein